MLPEDDPQRLELEQIFEDFYQKLKNTARDKQWGRETHDPLSIKLLNMIAIIIPEILNCYDGKEKEGKILSVAAQIRFSIEDVMPWKRFLEITNTKAMDDLSSILVQEKAINIMSGFLENNGVKEERGRAQYIF